MRRGGIPPLSTGIALKKYTGVVPRAVTPTSCSQVAQAPVYLRGSKYMPTKQSVAIGKDRLRAVLAIVGSVLVADVPAPGWSGATCWVPSCAWKQAVAHGDQCWRQPSHRQHDVPIARATPRAERPVLEGARHDQERSASDRARCSGGMGVCVSQAPADLPGLGIHHPRKEWNGTAVAPRHQKGGSGSADCVQGATRRARISGRSQPTCAPTRPAAAPSASASRISRSKGKPAPPRRPATWWRSRTSRARS